MVTVLLGLEAAMWSEITRTNEQLEEMMYPRLLGVAERSWHRAFWEGKEESSERSRDWQKFVNVVSRKELWRLEKLGISYYLPRPGVR